MVNYYDDLKQIARANLDSRISDIALDSIINEALESLPVIYGNIPFGISEEEYIKFELLKQVNNIVTSIMKNTPFGIDEVQYINMTRTENKSKTNANSNSNSNSNSNIYTSMPFGVDEAVYFEKMQNNNSSVNMPFGTEEIAQNMVDAMASSSVSYEDSTSIMK